MLVGLEKCARCIDRCAIYQRLYLTGASSVSDTEVQLEQVMMDLCVSVLQFQITALKYYRKNTAGTDVLDLII